MNKRFQGGAKSGILKGSDDMGMHSESGALLIAEGLITEQQLQKSLSFAILHRASFVQSVIQLGFVTEERLASFLSTRLKLPMANEPQFENLPVFLIRLVPVDIVKSYGLVPIMLHKGVLHVALSDATDRAALEEVAFATGYAVSAVVARNGLVQRAIEKYYGVFKDRQLASASGLGVKATVSAGSDADAKTNLGTKTGSDRYESRLMDNSLEALFRREVERIAEMSFKHSEVRSSEKKPSSIEDAILFQAQLDWPGEQQDTHPEAHEELTPIFDFETAKSLLDQANDRDQVARIFIRFTLAFVHRSVLLFVKQNNVIGWIGAGEGISPENTRGASFALDSPSVFKTVKETGSEYFGSLPRTDVNGVFIKTLGEFRPKRMLLIPIKVHGKLVCMLYADCGRSSGFSKDLSLMHIMVAHVCKAFEELVVKSKLSRAPDQSA